MRQVKLTMHDLITRAVDSIEEQDELEWDEIVYSYMDKDRRNKLIMAYHHHDVDRFGRIMMTALTDYLYDYCEAKVLSDPLAYLDDHEVLTDDS